MITLQDRILSNVEEDPAGSSLPYQDLQAEVVF
jgi:hypothetical protein